MTQVDLAHALGITQAALSNYELGKRRLYLHQIERIASVLGKGLDFFVQGKEAGSGSTGPCPDESAVQTSLIDRISSLTPGEARLLEEFLDYLQWRRDHAPGK